MHCQRTGKIWIFVNNIPVFNICYSDNNFDKTINQLSLYDVKVVFIAPVSAAGDLINWLTQVKTYKNKITDNLQVINIIEAIWN